MTLCQGSAELVGHIVTPSMNDPRHTAAPEPLMAQAYRWPDTGLFLSPVTSLAVVKAQ